MAKTIQDQLADKIKAKFPEAEVKKINKDNFLDIHLPRVHPKRGTHLFFNTGAGAIKVGFYCREEDFTQKILAKSSNLEAYSQGVRPRGNPEWKTVEAACAAVFEFVESMSGKADQGSILPIRAAISQANQKIESPSATASKENNLSSFDLIEFDLEGRPKGMKDASQSPPVSQGKLAGPSQADETDRCLDDPMPFLTCIQLIRIYYLVLSSDSKAYRASFEETLREFTKSAVIPRISNDVLRIVHEDGQLIESLLLGPMLKAEDIYDKDFSTHNDYTCSLAGQIEELLSFCNAGLFLDTLELFMYLGDMLEEEDSPSGSLAPQDRYFPLFLMLKASPEQDIENFEMVFSKGLKSRNAKSGCDVKDLVLKASGNFNQLSNEEKLALVLYDFILWDEKPGLDIKLGDIAAAKSIFTNVTQNSALGEKLVGGFEDNASYEIFQFFNVEFNREGFHEFCLARWKELSSEWNPLKLQLLIEGVRRDFHPNTYINNPVLDDYLNIFTGVKVVDLPASPAPAKEQKEEDEGPYILNEKKKTLEITSIPHCILFVILQVGFKMDNYTSEEMADIKSTAVSLGDWFDLDQDECLEVLDEILELLIKCKSIFDLKELGNLVSANCLVIHSEISNEGVRGDIVRFMNDLANADGKVTEEEEANLLFYSVLINYGGSMFN